MSNISKEILRNYVNEQKFKSPDEVLAAMKEMFKMFFKKHWKQKWIPSLDMTNMM